MQLYSLVLDGADTWIGAYNSGGWKWNDAHPWSYTKWASGEPANTHGVLHKLSWMSAETNNWKTAAAADLHSSVCQKPATFASVTAQQPNFQDCEVSAWSKWSESPQPPLQCFKSRTRSVKVFNYGGGAVCPVLSETKSCQHCQVSMFTGWTACVDGYRARWRHVTVPAFGGGEECPNLVQQEPCVDCTVSLWGSWSSCSNNEVTRTRTITFQDVFNSNPCPALVEIDACQDCEVSPWSGWSTASELISTGTTSHLGKPYIPSSDNLALLQCSSGANQRTRAVLKVIRC